jgi:uncharacterized paraquat-inducible protein A
MAMRWTRNIRRSRAQGASKRYADWLVGGSRRAGADPRRCPVCGHRSLTPIRHSLNWLLAVLLGAALCYIALDVAADGRLDNHLWRAFTTPPSERGQP